MDQNPLVFKLKKLADEGEALLRSGYEIPVNSSANVSPPVFDWLLKCNSFLAGNYGKKSDIYEEFSQAYTIRMSVNVLVSLAADEIHKQTSNQKRPAEQPAPQKAPEDPEGTKLWKKQEEQVVFLLQDILPPGKKAEASYLWERLVTELAELQPNWEKVSGLLKCAFDYGIPFGSELTALAYSRYKTKSL